jgi:PEP-CTERM motif
MMKRFDVDLIRAAAFGGAIVLTTAFAAAAPQQALVHTNSVYVGNDFGAFTGYGDYPLSLAFDGTNAYVGGFATTPGSPVGVVKVVGITGASPTTSPMPNTMVTTPDGRGLDALAYEATTDSLIMFHDTGDVFTSTVSRRNASDGSEVWTTTSPGGARPVAGAIDPIGDAGSPMVAFLAWEQGRRLGLDLDDGSLIYGASGSANPGGIILGEKDGTTNWAAAFRGLDMDSDGNIATLNTGYTGGYTGYGERIGTNQWQSLDGTADRISIAAENDGPIIWVGQDVAILEGLGPDGGDLLAFSSRGITQTTDLNGVTTSVSNTQVHIRNIDGSTTGLTQTTLIGGEEGIAWEWLNNTKSLAFGVDASGKPTLLVLDFIDKQLDVYQAPVTVLDGDLDLDGFVGINDLNIVLGSWNSSVTPGDLGAGDPTGDGFVGIEDLNKVLGNWNAGTPPAAAAVPEPTTLALLGLGGLAMLRRKH